VGAARLASIRRCSESVMALRKSASVGEESLFLRMEDTENGRLSWLQAALCDLGWFSEPLHFRNRECYVTPSGEHWGCKPPFYVLSLLPRSDGHSLLGRLDSIWKRLSTNRLD